MQIEEHLLIAIIAAFVNFLLSLILPPLLKNSTIPFSQEIRKHYECNKNIILVSSIITIIFVYISLKITPLVKSNFLSGISKLNIDPINIKPITSFGNTSVPVVSVPAIDN